MQSDTEKTKSSRMEYFTSCPYCLRKLHVQDGWVGAKIRCADCQEIFRLPEPDAPPLPRTEFARRLPPSRDSIDVFGNRDEDYPPRPRHPREIAVSRTDPNIHAQIGAAIATAVIMLGVLLTTAFLWPGYLRDTAVPELAKEETRPRDDRPEPEQDPNDPRPKPVTSREFLSLAPADCQFLGGVNLAPARHLIDF